MCENNSQPIIIACASKPNCPFANAFKCTTTCASNEFSKKASGQPSQEPFMLLQCKPPSINCNASSGEKKMMECKYECIPKNIIACEEKPCKLKVSQVCKPPTIPSCEKARCKLREPPCRVPLNSTKVDPCLSCPIFPLRRCKSSELRASIFYQSCECVKRNGLQSDCGMTGCHGQPQCINLPDPCCIPSQFARKFEDCTFGIPSNARKNDPKQKCVPKPSPCSPPVSKLCQIPPCVPKSPCDPPSPKLCKMEKICRC